MYTSTYTHTCTLLTGDYAPCADSSLRTVG